MTRLFFAVAAVALLSVACSSPSVATPTALVPGKYEQTWTKPYGETTCGDWARGMTDHERSVMALDLLVCLRLADDIDAAFPSDRLINSFVDAIGVRCDDAGEKVHEVVVGAYDATSELHP